MALVCGGAALAGPAHILHVDCAVRAIGDGSRAAPFGSIGAALPAAKALSTEREVTVQIAAGACDQESLPLRLDFPVRVRGARIGRYDQRGFPLGEQSRDTLVTWTVPASIPAGLAFFEITASDVEVSRLSVDGRRDIGPDVPAPIPAAPYGVFVRDSSAFVVTELRIVGMANAIRASGASGRITNNYIAATNAGLVLFGGLGVGTPTVAAFNNRIEYKHNGIVLAGAQAVTGSALDAFVFRNDMATHYTNTGPSNPAALRLSPAAGPALDGRLAATLLLNEIRGTPDYSITVHSGPMTSRRPDRAPYTGAVDVTVFGTRFDTSSVARSLITFTAARATVLPCELDPANGLAECPLLMGPPQAPLYWEYLTYALYDVRHGGELDGALIDHPAVEPVDGRVLNNRLLVNGRQLENKTFVVVP